MEQKNQGTRFWRLFGPLLLYWIVEFFATMIAEVVVLLPHWGELIDYDVVSGMTSGEIMDYALSNADKVYEIMSRYSVQITTFVGLATVPLTLTMFLMDRKRDRVLELPQNKKAGAVKYAAIAAIGVCVCIGLNNLATMANLAFYSESYQQTSANFYAASFPMQIICLGVIAPITEELLFRGLLFKRYREVGSFTRAMFYSSLLFAFSHGNMVQFLYAMAIGMLAAYVYEKYGSFKAPVFLHIVVNLASLICTRLGGFAWMNEAPVRMGLAVVACAFVGSVMFVFIQRIEEQPDSDSIGKPEEKVTPDMFR